MRLQQIPLHKLINLTRKQGPKRAGRAADTIARTRPTCASAFAIAHVRNKHAHTHRRIGKHKRKSVHMRERARTPECAQTQGRRTLARARL
eukprot:6183711-Pleurochrysis_carterae.AAC.1